VDANPYEQGKFALGRRIPILAPEAIREARPAYLLILPWNLKDEMSRGSEQVDLCRYPPLGVSCSVA
jgi:hypothetical protein